VLENKIRKTFLFTTKFLNYCRVRNDRKPNVTMQIRRRYNTWREPCIGRRRMETNRGFRETWGWRTNKRDKISNAPRETDNSPSVEYIYNILLHILYIFYFLFQNSITFLLQLISMLSK